MLFLRTAKNTQFEVQKKKTKTKYNKWPVITPNDITTNSRFDNHPITTFLYAYFMHTYKYIVWNKWDHTSPFLLYILLFLLISSSPLSNYREPFPSDFPYPCSILITIIHHVELPQCYLSALSVFSILVCRPLRKPVQLSITDLLTAPSAQHSGHPQASCFGSHSRLTPTEKSRGEDRPGLQYLLKTSHNLPGWKFPICKARHLMATSQATVTD